MNVTQISTKRLNEVDEKRRKEYKKALIISLTVMLIQNVELFIQKFINENIRILESQCNLIISVDIHIDSNINPDDALNILLTDLIITKKELIINSFAEALNIKLISQTP